MTKIKSGLELAADSKASATNAIEALPKKSKSIDQLKNFFEFCFLFSWNKKLLVIFHCPKFPPTFPEGQKFR